MQQCHFILLTRTKNLILHDIIEYNTITK